MLLLSDCRATSISLHAYGGISDTSLHTLTNVGCVSLHLACVVLTHPACAGSDAAVPEPKEWALHHKLNACELDICMWKGLQCNASGMSRP